MISHYFLSALIFIIYKTLRWTWRVELIEPPEMTRLLREKKPFILAHWHGDELSLIHLARRYRIGTIVSTSKDGQLMNQVLIWLGASTSRGSSTRGGVGALKGLIRLVRNGNNCSFAVDGPKGPLHKVKPGVFEVSKSLGLPVFWVGVASNRAFHFKKSWNQASLPRPFARVKIQWHGPMIPLSAETDPRSADLARTLERELHAAKQQALASFAVPDTGC
ncbi:MAG TPA: lysophospholipid acyltransferase family protein [Pseudobdellovibrionaceae bacterium]|nr:lysophospholipid acyltransferase family protein [Pseudobdellovibrionaceae bacterium]